MSRALLKTVALFSVLFLISGCTILFVETNTQPYPYSTTISLFNNTGYFLDVMVDGVLVKPNLFPGEIYHLKTWSYYYAVTVRVSLIAKTGHGHLVGSASRNFWLSGAHRYVNWTVHFYELHRF